MNALKLYAQHLKQRKVHEQIMEDLKAKVLRELKKIPGGKTAIDGVEFHRTTKVTRKFHKEIQELLDQYHSENERLKECAEEAGLVRLIKKPTFDAAIPKSSERKILKPLHAFQKYFGSK
jgi:hypothetical protein